MDQGKRSLFLNPRALLSFSLLPDEWKRNDYEANAMIIFLFSEGSNAAAVAFVIYVSS